MIMNQISHLLSLMELFAQRQRPMTLTQISDELGLPKSTMHNMIETLTVRGYLYEVRTRGGFYPSRKLFTVADMIAGGDPITLIIQDFLRKLAFDTGETAILAIRDKSSVVYLDVVESQQPIKYSASAGDRRPIYAVSGGKAILSTYTDEVLEKALTTMDFSDARERTIQDAQTLKEALNEGKKKGFFQNLSEYTPEVSGVGIPIMVEGRTLGLSIAGPNHRMAGKHAVFAQCLHKTAADISEALNSAGIGQSTHIRKV